LYNGKGEKQTAATASVGRDDFASFWWHVNATAKQKWKAANKDPHYRIPCDSMHSIGTQRRKRQLKNEVKTK
jgi:hypothetical protein